MASGRDSRIDLASLVSKSKTQDPDTRDHTGVSTETSKPSRLKKHKPSLPSIPQQDETPLSKTTTSESMGSKPLWASHTKLYSLQFGASDYFPVAEKKRQKKDSNPDQNPVVIIKTFTGSATHDNIQDIKRIKHKSFVSIRNTFLVGGEISVAFEFMPLSLSEIAGNPLIDDLRLASILGPVRHSSSSPVKNLH
ncbi:hypothetical protein VCV18_004844 [Metarhizium anisopliae]